MVKTITKLIGYEYSNDDWNNKGMLLLADTYLAKEEDADAQVILETIIGGDVKQEYLEEAQKKLEILKEKERKKQEMNAPVPEKTLQIDFNQSKSDSTLFINESEMNSIPNTTVTEQPQK